VNSIDDSRFPPDSPAGPDSGLDSRADPVILSYEDPHSVESNPVAEAQPDFYGWSTRFAWDLRVPWGWTDLFLLFFVGIAAMALSTFLLAIVFQSRGIGFVELQRSSRQMSIFALADQIVVWLVVWVYLVAQIRLRFDSPFWRTLGWRGIDVSGLWGRFGYLRFVASGFLLSLLVQLASSVFPAKTKLPMERFFQDRESAVFLMLMSVLLAPLVEETVFRGYIYPVVARSFGVAVSVIATGTLFGLLHADQLWGGFWQIALMVVVGIIFTWVRAATRTVLASYLLHLSYNSFLFLAFLFSTSGLRSLPR
jgi:membrane protease YdiL (CAAX protease family)